MKGVNTKKPLQDGRKYLPASGRYESTPEQAAMRAAALTTQTIEEGYDTQPETHEGNSNARRK